MIIFLAGLKNIPVDLYESASIDGAGAIYRFFKITLPMLSPVIFFNLILGTISVFQQFNAAFIITTGGPAGATYLYALMLYETAFVHFRMGYASALAWVLLSIVAMITAVNFLVSKYWVFYGDERG
jgi:multiple sugar transport system permease protein